MDKNNNKCGDSEKLLKNRLSIWNTPKRLSSSKFHDILKCDYNQHFWNTPCELWPSY